MKKITQIDKKWITEIAKTQKRTTFNAWEATRAFYLEHKQK